MKMNAKYVLCNWRGRLWPAKILSSSETLLKSKKRGSCFLEVQLLSLGKILKVKSSKTRMLTKSQVKAIVSSYKVICSKTKAPRKEERAHKRSLKMALNILEKTHRAPFSSLHRKGTTTLSQSGVQKTPKTCTPQKSENLKRAILTKCGKEIQSCRCLVVSLVRCDNLLNKYLTMNPVVSLSQLASEQRVSSKFPSLSEGSDENKGKAGPSTFVPQGPMVLQKDACSEPPEHVSTGPSSVKRQRQVRASAKAGWGSFPKSLALSHEGVASPQNMEGPGCSKLHSSDTTKSATSDISSNRKRKRQVLTPSPVPTSHREKIQSSKYLRVSLVRCDHLVKKNLAKNPTMSLSQSASKLRRGSGNFPSISESSDENKGKCKAGPSAKCQMQVSAVRQVGRGSFPKKTLVLSHQCIASLQNIAGPSWSLLHSSGKAKSANSDIHFVNRKRKRQVSKAESQLQEESSKGNTGAPGPSEAKEGNSQVCPIESGMVVWYKFQDYPYWPAVVTRIYRADKTACVLLLEAFMSEERKGLKVAQRRLKHFDCPEKTKFEKRARKRYGLSVDWCCSLVDHYMKAVSNMSFEGTFLEYFADDISYPIRKAVQEGDVDADFPKVNYQDFEDFEEELAQESPLIRKRFHQKLLPDRTKAARDRENQKLLDFIVIRKGVESHLLDIINGRKQSTWLNTFLNSKKHKACTETYLEDDDQLDVLVKYLQDVYKQIDEKTLARIRHDKINFIVEVLLPEAIIYAISVLEGLDYKEAENKYLQGPPINYREKELFDRKVFIERKRKLSRSTAY